MLVQDHPDHGVTKIYVQLPNMCIELLHPLGKESPVANFLQKNPKGGIHHFCLAVSNYKRSDNLRKLCLIRQCSLHNASPF